MLFFKTKKIQTINYITRQTIATVFVLNIPLFSLAQIQQKDKLEQSGQPLLVAPYHEAKIHEYYQNEVLEQSQIYRAGRISPWTNLIPGISTTALYNSNTETVQVFPSLSFSLSSVIRAVKLDRQQKASYLKIKKQLRESERKDMLTLVNLNIQVKLQREKVRFEKEKLQIQKKIFAYDSAQYEARKIHPDKYYRSRLQLLARKTEVVTEALKLEYLLEKVLGLVREPRESKYIFDYNHHQE